MIYPIKLLLLVLAIVPVGIVAAQQSKNFVVERQLDTSGNADQKKYTKVVFKFFDHDSNDNPVRSAAINIDNIKLPANPSTGEAIAYLTNTQYTVYVDYVSWAKSEKLKLKIDPLYTYIINVYLDHSKEKITGNDNSSPGYVYKH
jgi:hypothetical protein